MPRDRKLFSVPRGPPEWGKLLYEPQWAKERRFKSSESFMMLPMSVVIIGFFIWAIFGSTTSGEAIVDDEEQYFMAMLVVLCVVMVAMAVHSTRGEFKRMPLRVYEAGFTQEEVPLWMGVRRKEVLVHKDRLQKVTVQEEKGGLQPKKYIGLEFLNDDGAPTKLIKDAPGLEDPLALLLALQAMAPDTMGESTLPYLDPDRPIPPPEETRRGSLPFMFPFELMIVCGMLLMPCSMTIMFPLMVARPQAWWIVTPLLGMYAFFLVFSIRAARRILVRHYLSTWNDPDATLEEDGIRSPATFLERFLLRIGEPIPLEGVRSVRRLLEPRTFTPRFELEPVRGAVVAIHRNLHDSIAERPDFQRDGFEHVNTRSSEGAGPLVRMNWLNLTALLLAFSIVGLVIMSGFLQMMEDTDTEPTDPEEEREARAWEMKFYMVGMAFIGITTLIGLPWLLLIRRLQVIGKEFHVDEREIRMPGAQRAFRVISKDEVLSIRTKKIAKRVMWCYLVIETTRGTTVGPTKLVPELRAHGYLLEDPEGLLSGELAGDA